MEYSNLTMLTDEQYTEIKELYEDLEARVRKLEEKVFGTDSQESN